MWLFEGSRANETIRALWLQDFAGFRVVALLPRFRPAWPPPGAYDETSPRQFK